jgi:hypothetical protein
LKNLEKAISYHLDGKKDDGAHILDEPRKGFRLEFGHEGGFLISLDF